MKTRLFTILALVALLLTLLPSVPVSAQSCETLTATDPDVNGFNALPLGSPYPTAPAEYFAGDFYGYTITTPNGVVKLGYYDASGVFVSNEYHTFISNVAYTIDVHTAAIAVYRASVFTANVCTPTPPTATPTATNTAVPPTATATVTNTPEIVVTATPVPPTLTPTITTEVYLSNIQAISENNFKWGIFVGVVLLGLGVIALLRVL